MRFSSLDAWLAWQETLHPAEIELGLERVGRVLYSLRPEPPPFALITVAGTNGKGSTVALLEAMLCAAGYRVGAYTSPHLLRYNERVRLQGEAVEDGALCAAFEAVDGARGEIPLTYFEFGTLAAVEIFYRAGVEIALLEVGLGGRLDAVNVLEPDVAVVTTVDLDHAEWLGEDREAVGREKAGIFRAGRPAVCGESSPPQSLLAQAVHLGTPLYRLGEAFGAERRDGEWRWWGPDGRQRHALPLPALRGAAQLDNAATALMALELLAGRFPLDNATVRRGLQAVRLAGRFEVVAGEVPLILDVAHNPQAAARLADNLAAMPCQGRTLAVVGMLGDKDLGGVLARLESAIDLWYPAAPAAGRAAPAARLLEALAAVGVAPAAIHMQPSVDTALAAARASSRPGDRIVVFGSFYTVAEAMAGLL